MLKLFEQHNAEFEKKVGHNRAQGTFTRYRTVCNHIREFLPHTYKREDIPLKELNLTFINDFEYFLRTEKNHSPVVDSIAVKRRGAVRKAKLYYLRERTGKSARIKERLN